MNEEEPEYEWIKIKVTKQIARELQAMEERGMTYSVEFIPHPAIPTKKVK